MKVFLIVFFYIHLILYYQTIGIHSVLVALLAERAEVKYDPAHLLPTQIAGLINNLGFQAEVLETVARGMEMIDVNVG